MSELPFNPEDLVARADQISQLEQKWALADQELAKMLVALTGYIQPVSKVAQLDPHNPSFAFDGVKTYIFRVLKQYPPGRQGQVLFMLATSALTRLVCAPHTKETDDILAQLEKGMNQ